MGESQGGWSIAQLGGVVSAWCNVHAEGGWSVAQLGVWSLHGVMYMQREAGVLRYEGVWSMHDAMLITVKSLSLSLSAALHCCRGGEGHTE